MADAADEVVKLGVHVTGTSDAAASIGQMEEQIRGASGAVRELEAQLKVMQSQKSVDVAQFRDASAALEAQRAKVAELQAQFVALGGKAEAALKATKPPPDAAAGIDKLKDATKGLGGALQSASKPAAAATINTDKLKNATNKLGGALGPTGAAAIELGESLFTLGAVAAGALIAVAALIAALTILALGVRQAAAASDAARSELLSLQGALKGDAVAAGELADAITRVAAVSALGRAQISGYGQELAKAGLRGDQLRIALDAAAVAGSAGGDALAKSFIAQAAAAARAGQSVDDLAAKIKQQYGGVAARQLLSLSVQAAKFKENLDALFAGANIEPFLAALADMLSIFSQSTSTGQAMRDVLSKAMSDFFAGAALVLPYVKEGFLGFLIVVLQAYIWIKKAANALRDFVGPIGDVDGLGIALTAGKVAGYALLAVVLLLVAAVGLLLLPWIILGVAIWAAWTAANALWDAIKEGWESVKASLSDAVDSVLEFAASVAGAFSGIDLAAVASDMIDGLVSGITGGIGRVIGAVTDLAKQAISAMRGALDSHSPSEIFRAIGDVGIGGGLVLGMSDAEADVEAGVEDLVDPRDVKTEARAARSGSSGRPIVFIENLNVRDFDDFRARLAEEFEIAAGSAAGA